MPIEHLDAEDEITVSHLTLIDGNEILSNRTFLPSNIMTISQHRETKRKF